MVNLVIRADVATGIFTPDPVVEDDPGNPFWATEFDFDANLSQSSTDHRNIFLNNGFSGLKDEITNPGAAKGYISTVTEVHGHPGVPIPCDSGRACRMESAVVAGGGANGDFYYQIGGGTIGWFPPDFWAEEWVFPNRTGDEMSEFEETKDWYWLTSSDPDGNYPGDGFADICRPNRRNVLRNQTTGATHQTGYTIGSYTHEYLGGPSSTGVPRLVVAAQVATGAGSRATPNFQDGDKEWIRPNMWTKLRYHYDFDQNPGRLRVWSRRVSPGVGDADFQIIFDSAVPGYTWNTVASDWGGFRAVRTPVTTGPTNGSGPDNITYKTRIRFANTEADLGVQRVF